MMLDLTGPWRREQPRSILAPREQRSSGAGRDDPRGAASGIRPIESARGGPFGRGDVARARHAHRRALHAARRWPLSHRHPDARLRRHRRQREGMGDLAAPRGLRGLHAGQLRRARAHAPVRRHLAALAARARRGRLRRRGVSEDAGPGRRGPHRRHRLLARRLDAARRGQHGAAASRRVDPRLHPLLPGLRRLHAAAGHHAHPHAPGRQGRLGVRADLRGAGQVGRGSGAAGHRCGFPNARHHFDGAELRKLTIVADARGGRGATMDYDPRAHEDAEKQLRAFLAAHLGK